MIDSINKWVDVVSNAVAKLGLNTILIFFGMGLLTGIVPSALTQAHDKQTMMLWQNQIMLSGVFAFKHAECLNKAEADGNDVEWMVKKFMRRCDDANERMNRHLNSIGVPQMKQGEKS